MEKRELTCIGCPLGCSITVTLENGEIRDVTGYTCKRGHDYARKEVTNPTRIVTSTVRLTGSRTGACVVSCKTAQDIPKGKIFEIVAALKGVTATAPVHIGDVLLADVAGTGVDIIATKNVQSPPSLSSPSAPGAPKSLGAPGVFPLRHAPAPFGKGSR